MKVKENQQQFDYMMLSRLQSDCEYFLNYGNRCVKHLYYDTIEEHISEMKKLWNKLILKPEWLSIEEIKEYQQKMFTNKK